ncbi:MAG: RsmD family RNA methyltransferase [Alphaproteobacteria bacterium]|nr:RsmD family RNA methyltransferase [Alphaproteobacteria bacterium]MBN2779909.1 RsmD family RNA methyltransferase [Alphaproteobacteria bacterium]
MLKITGGTFRGKKLILPEESLVRPTSTRAREALFSVLYAKYPDGFETIIEPFAGSAAMSFEALSRKVVKKAIVFEKETSVIKIIEKNRASFKEALPMKIKEADVMAETFSEYGKALVFIDPPYKDFEKIEKIIQKLKEKCSEGSLFICETESETAPLENPTDTRKYGRAHFYFYEV